MSAKLRKSLSLQSKLDILKKFDAGAKNKQLSVEYSVPHNTISSIIKNKEHILEKASKFSLHMKKSRSPKFILLVQALIIFCQQAIACRIPLSGRIIKEKASELARKLNQNSFQASDGWLQKFVKRHDLSYKVASGESGAVNSNEADCFKTKTLPTLLEKHSPNNIFNMDETGLFFKCVPNKTYFFKNDKCHGGKHSKERITVVVATNMDGSEKLELLIIGKSAKPRCFKNVKNLPVTYKSNSKSWMVSPIFEEWALALDSKMRNENREIILFVDNCPSHPKMQTKLRNIELHFFPPNMTSVLQPLDLGIIKCLKVHYRNKLVKKQLDAMEKQEDYQVNLLQCMIIHIDENDLNDENIDGHSSFETLSESGFESFDDFVTFDDDICSSELLSDDDIIQIVRGESSASFASSTDEVAGRSEIELTTPSDAHLSKAFEVIYSGLMIKEGIEKNSFKSFFDLKKQLLRNE